MLKIYSLIYMLCVCEKYFNFQNNFLKILIQKFMFYNIKNFLKNICTNRKKVLTLHQQKEQTKALKS